MIYLISILTISVVFNILLIWYITKILSKLLYTSDNIGDLYIAFRLYEKFTTAMYDMDMFYGEPILKELVAKTKFIREEIERFEEIYGLTTDTELLEGELFDDETNEEAPEAY